jgi:hypothetical protein
VVKDGSACNVKSRAEIHLAGHNQNPSLTSGCHNLDDGTHPLLGHSSSTPPLGTQGNTNVNSFKCLHASTKYSVSNGQAFDANWGRSPIVEHASINTQPPAIQEGVETAGSAQGVGQGRLGDRIVSNSDPDFSRTWSDLSILDLVKNDHDGVEVPQKREYHDPTWTNGFVLEATAPKKPKSSKKMTERL